MHIDAYTPEGVSNPVIEIEKPIVRKLLHQGFDDCLKTEFSGELSSKRNLCKVKARLHQFVRTVLHDSPNISEFTEDVIHFLPFESNRSMLEELLSLAHYAEGTKRNVMARLLTNLMNTCPIGTDIFNTNIIVRFTNNILEILKNLYQDH